VYAKVPLPQVGYFAGQIILNRGFFSGSFDFIPCLGKGIILYSALSAVETD
jgi:hypothetical protein